MVESEADGLNEEVMLGAVMFGHEQMQIAIKAINELAAEAGKPKWSWVAPEPKTELEDRAVSGIRRDESGRRLHLDRKAAALRQDQGSQSRHRRSLAKATQGRLAGEVQRGPSRRRILQPRIPDGARAASSKAQPRIDGRDTQDRARRSTSAPACCARTHGSALFTRGETQALVVTTLGTGRDAQIIDGLRARRKEPFMLHYNFPPFSVGETGMMGSPKRREIGHGNLAKRGVKAVHAGRREIPLRHPRRVGNSRIEWFDLHGFGVRHQPGIDGRGRADQGAGRRRRDGPGQRRRALPGTDRHPRRRRSPRRHGFQGGRYQRRHHRAADGHQDHRASRAKS